MLNDLRPWKLDPTRLDYWSQPYPMNKDHAQHVREQLRQAKPPPITVDCSWT